MSLVVAASPPPFLDSQEARGDRLYGQWQACRDLGRISVAHWFGSSISR